MASVVVEGRRLVRMDSRGCQIERKGMLVSLRHTRDHVICTIITEILRASRFSVRNSLRTHTVGGIWGVKFPQATRFRF